MNKIEAVLEKSRELLRENKFYEYEQKLKTLSSRYYNTGKFEEANSLLLGGALDLIENAQVNSAYDLVNTTLQAFKSKEAQLDDLTKNKITMILSRAPWDKNKPTLINKIFQWFYPKNQDQYFLKFICEESLKNKDYQVAQKFLLRCDNSNQLAIQMLNEWMCQGNQNERELFVVRFVLLKLACNRVEDAKFLITEYAPQFNYPIIHFTRLLVRAVDIKSEKSFNILSNDYKKTYEIDPSFKALIEKIGSVHFNIQSEKEGGFLDGFMKFFSE